MRSFARSLRRFIVRWRIAHGVVLFDVSRDTFRRSLDPRYKAHRPAPPASLRWELAQAEEVASAMGFGVYASPEFEADDLAATYCRLSTRAGRPVRVLAEDKDLFQLVTDAFPSVAVVSLRTGGLIDEAAVCRKLGVRPDQVVDFQSLVGDATDGVRGVHGIGPKTAAGLLQLGTLVELLREPERAAEASVRGARRLPERLREGRATVALARALVELRADVPLDGARRVGTVLPASWLHGLALRTPDPDALVWERIGMPMPE